MKEDTNYIWITTSMEGFHAYPDAPDEVAFLRNRHRHLFHFRVYIEVFHDDREIEFFMFKRDVEKMIKFISCLLYTSPSPRDKRQSRMPSSA